MTTAPPKRALLGRVHRYYTVVVFIVLASLDNVAAGLVPPLYTPIGDDLGVSRSTMTTATAATFFFSAVAAVGWAYVGDRSNRKPLLMLGTLIWAAGTFATPFAPNFAAFLGAQVVGGIGLGAVGSVGFSVVNDLIGPRRRGVVMSFWGLSQGVGTLAGTLVGGLLGASDWRRPFYVITVVGVAATAAYLFTSNIRRGESEPQLAQLYAAGGDYDYRITRADLPHIAGRRTNIYLILQGFFGQFVFGSFVLLPALFQAKAQALGYSESTAIAIGSLYATLFQLGGVLSIIGGIVGDRVQRRRPGGRALVAGIGILAGAPFFVLLFFVPLRLDVPDGAGAGTLATGVLGSIVTEPVMALSFVFALVALALTSANAPNWFALVGEVNPPEHRGTVYSLVNLVNGVGRAAGNRGAGWLIGVLGGAMASPTNYVVGMAGFQLFFIPTGIAFLLAARTSARDVATVREMLDERASEASQHPSADRTSPPARPPAPATSADP
jgi:MFS transporter, Spinster family, sphingosine-1-phosphate transporter